jgi:secernin
MCDTLVTLTDDGVLLAKNSDRDPNEAQQVRWHAAAEHEPGAPLATTWSSVPQVARTHAVVLSQPWWMWGAEMGANEHGVVIGNEAVFTRRAGDRGEGTLLGMDLLRLGLERGATRHEAVEVIVGLLERHGQGGSCSHEHPRFTYDSSFLVADPSGAVVLETAGRHWATEEVAGARSISNGLTIPGFADRHADPVRGRVAACATRQGRTAEAARRATGPGDLVAALRDHGDRTSPSYSVVNGALSAPCAHAGGLVTSTQTTASWVADLRPGTPPGGRHWVTGASAPCTSLFKPVTVGEPHDPDGGRRPTNRFDPHFLWWRHESLHRLLLRDAERLLPDLARERDALERDWLRSPPSAVEAFRAGEVWTDDWLERLRSGGSVADRRPVWVRRQWRAWDRQAGITSGSDFGSPSERSMG